MRTGFLYANWLHTLAIYPYLSLCGGCERRVAKVAMHLPVRVAVQRIGDGAASALCAHFMPIFRLPRAHSAPGGGRAQPAPYAALQMHTQLQIAITIRVQLQIRFRIRIGIQTNPPNITAHSIESASHSASPRATSSGRGSAIAPAACHLLHCASPASQFPRLRVCEPPVLEQTLALIMISVLTGANLAAAPP